MSYMIMETRKAYAVALDGEGRFMKVANLGYELGDTVEAVVPLKGFSQKRTKPGRRALAGALALAACLMLVCLSAYRANFALHGTVRISINPDVLLNVSRTERVLEVEGLNDDGRSLVEQYDYRGKKRDTVVGELVARAASQGYLRSGGEVNITLDSDDARWQSEAEAALTRQLRPQLENSGVTVTMSSAGESVPHTVMSAQPEAQGGWHNWDSYEEYHQYRVEHWGDLIEQFGQDPGGAMEQFGKDTGEALEQFGQATGEAAEQFGQAMEDWGEAVGEAAEDKFANEEYWKKFLSGGVSGEDIGGLLRDIWHIFG